MDPDANLKEQRALVVGLIRQIDKSDEAPDSADVDRLLELVQSLDTWLRRGGHLPEAWKAFAGEAAETFETFLASRTELSKLLQDNERLLAQVTETQIANTKLLEDNRRMKAALGNPCLP